MSLQGKILRCDCDREFCHSEVLVAACLEANGELSSKRRQGGRQRAVGRVRARCSIGLGKAVLVAAGVGAATAEGRRVASRPWPWTVDLCDLVAGVC